jgi:hypothetical protein
MSVERTYYCEGPTCGAREDGDPQPIHVRTAIPPPHLPSSVIETRQRDAGIDDVHHFCGWDCLMRYAAEQPLPLVLGDDE